MVPRLQISRLLTHSYGKLFLLCALGTAFLFTLQVHAKREDPIIVKGYVTATHFPESFDVNGTMVIVSPEAVYGFVGGNSVPGDKTLREEVRVGSYVKVAGTHE